ncbi:probable disease resistance protein At1g61300 [Durio zibethinus]|uniref:Probable disease resistance protein At1g61300 n=1 Tax=Durio zibethinus TaxID=66656 RepID=A0A6P5WNY0_DURZI|nr:probable disease resistance protein At1g61300 [Durio zibethinus]
MPGAGKTSVKLVTNELLKDTNQFNIVVWITVTRKCGVIELQNKIAQAISAVISEDEDETIREGMLPEILAQKGRYVLILDDVLDNFSLEEVGIPEPTARVILSLSVPLVYDKPQHHVDEKFSVVHKIIQTQYRKIDETVLRKLPLPSNKEEKMLALSLLHFRLND